MFGAVNFSCTVPGWQTGFDRALDDMSKRHRTFIASKETRGTSKHVVPVECLAFQHPAFCVEPKMDGERFMVHVSNDGVVKMHTRRGNWYRYGNTEKQATSSYT